MNRFFKSILKSLQIYSIILLIVSLPIIYVYLPDKAQYKKMVKTRQELSKRLERCKKDHQKLEDLKMALDNNDPFVVEMMARDVLGYGRKGEKVMESGFSSGPIMPRERLWASYIPDDNVKVEEPSHKKAVYFLVFIGVLVAAYFVLYRGKPDKNVSES